MKAAVAVLVVLALATSGSASAASAPATTLVSVSTSGDQANASSSNNQLGGVSLHGRYVVFESAASNLVDGDTNGVSDVFVRDVRARTTERVSVSSAGIQADGESIYATISGNGRYVAFLSKATNLGPGGDDDADWDVFRHDRKTGRTVMISVSPDGQPADRGAGLSAPSLSADGRYVAFSSFSDNLVAQDQNGTLGDVFVRDVTAGTTRIASLRTGTQKAANDKSYSPAISADGTKVVFISYATNLVHHDTNGAEDVFERDLESSTTTRVDVSSTGVQAKTDSDAAWPVVSADGRYVAFTSSAKNLVPNDTNHDLDVFVHDLVTHTTELVSQSTDGTISNRHSVGDSISGDGRFVTFGSGATNLPGASGAYLRDRATGTTTAVTVTSTGDPANGAGGLASLSGDGLHIVFSSGASNLVDDDVNGLQDVFIRKRG